MKVVKDYNELMKELSTMLETPMKKEGNYVAEEMKKQVDKTVYEQYDPKEYDRTYQLRDSIRAKKPKLRKTFAEVEINNDLREIKSKSPNQHYNVIETKGYSPTEIRKHIPYIVTKGKSGKIFGEGEWTKPRDYIAETEHKIKTNNEYIEKLAKYMKEEGIDVTIIR